MNKIRGKLEEIVFKISFHFPEEFFKTGEKAIMKIGDPWQLQRQQEFI